MSSNVPAAAAAALNSALPAANLRATLADRFAGEWKCKDTRLVFLCTTSDAGEPLPIPNQPLIAYCSCSQCNLGETESTKSRHDVYRGVCWLPPRRGAGPQLAELALELAQHTTSCDRVTQICAEIRTIRDEAASSVAKWEMVRVVAKRFNVEGKPDPNSHSEEDRKALFGVAENERRSLTAFFGPEYVVALYVPKTAPLLPVLVTRHRGVSLAQFLKETPCPRPHGGAYASEVHWELARAVLAAHVGLAEKLSAHGDVKCDNIVVYELSGTDAAPATCTFRSGEKTFGVQFIDFESVSDRAGADAADSGTPRAYTVSWASPQRLSDDEVAATAAGDLWPLALVLYEVLFYRQRSPEELALSAPLFFLDIAACPEQCASITSALARLNADAIAATKDGQNPVVCSFRGGVARQRPTLLVQMLQWRKNEPDDAADAERCSVVHLLRPSCCSKLAWSLLLPLLCASVSRAATADDALALVKRLRSQHLLARRLDQLADAFVRIEQSSSSKEVKNLLESIPPARFLAGLKRETQEELCKGRLASQRDASPAFDRLDPQLPLTGKVALGAVRNHISHPHRHSRVDLIFEMASCCDDFFAAMQGALWKARVLHGEFSSRYFIFPSDADEYKSLAAPTSLQGGTALDSVADAMLQEIKDGALSECASDLHLFGRCAATEKQLGSETPYSKVRVYKAVGGWKLSQNQCYNNNGLDALARMYGNQFREDSSPLLSEREPAVFLQMIRSATVLATDPVNLLCDVYSASAATAVCRVHALKGVMRREFFNVPQDVPQDDPAKSSPLFAYMQSRHIESLEQLFLLMNEVCFARGFVVEFKEQQYKQQVQLTQRGLLECRTRYKSVWTTEAEDPVCSLAADLPPHVKAAVLDLVGSNSHGNKGMDKETFERALSRVAQHPSPGAKLCETLPAVVAMILRG